MQNIQELEELKTLGLSEPLIIFLVVFFYIIAIIIHVSFWAFILKVIINSIRRSASHRYFKSNVVTQTSNDLKLDSNLPKNNIYIDVPKSKLEMFNTDNIDSLKDYFYDIFVNFENSYNSLDYTMMKLLSTKQLFNNYYTGITLDLKVGQKRIIDKIEKSKVIIYELDSTIAKQTVSAMIEISYINYVIDRKGYIISGDRYNPVTEKFEVTFRKDFENRDITKCPNCGADVEGKKCEYCRVNIKSTEFRISSIKKIIEK